MEYTIVGKIINTHGIKGEIKVFPLTNDIKRFDFLDYAYIGEEKILVYLEKVKYHKNLAILKFKGYVDINDVEMFKDDFIYVDEQEKIVLPENHFFIYELINSQVFDKEMNLIGLLIDVIQGSSNDVYVIKDKENKKEYLIPGVKEFVKKIDVKNKEIIIDPIEGMIE
ncbi:MAG TPA: ribosome maturation factor RimM [Tissierellaceae bacterium]|nr:ribosome maturation factor RimM [Tissierellaceae bacterium]